MAELPSKFRLARLISKQSDYKVQVGSVIYRGSTPISCGFNYLRSHPVYAKEYWSIHSEVSSILRANTDLTGCSIYVYREFKSGKPANSYPCEDCFKLIVASGIKKIYFTTDYGYDVLKL